MAKELPKFDTDEILWYDNGIWGRAGYAIPNPGGKTWSNNSVIDNLVEVIGRNMMELCHRDDVKFNRAPHYQFWYDLHQLIVTARKWLADNTRAPNDPRGLVPQHVSPNPRTFKVFPVPFFGERIRQPDIRRYTEIALELQGEMMQHSDNELTNSVSPAFTGQMGKFLQEILALFAMKYFGKTRDQAYAADFTLTDEDFRNYNPSPLMPPKESSEERPPLQWWPTENDLSQIRSIPINEALVLAKRWPVGDWLAQADGNAFPDPTAQTEETGTDGSGVVPKTAAGGQTVVGFQTPPGQAPA